MIKNLLFDLGGVIMDIRRENCVKAFRELGMKNPDEFLGEYVQQGPFEKIENGQWDEAQFHQGIRDIIGENVTDAQIDEAFQKFLIGIPLYRLKALDRLHAQYNVYLLSNTNPIMWNGKIAEEFAKDGHDVDYYFDGKVCSFEAGCMKPDEKIFRIVESRFGIKPSETVFFDDSQRNLDAAASLGFHTILVAPGTEYLTLLENSGLTTVQ
jgi:HAD hydrolase, family IA, variant 3